MSSSRLAFPSSHIGATVRRARLRRREIDEPRAGGAARQVEQRHLDRRMRAAVADERTVQHRPMVAARPGILADEERSQVITHRRHESAERIAGHGRGRRRFTPTDVAACRFHAHQQIVGLGDRHPRHLHRRLQRQGDRDGIDAADDQRRAVHPHRDRGPLRFLQHRHNLKRGSRKSRRLSPNRLKANTARLMAAPGNRIIHGASR